MTDAPVLRTVGEIAQRLGVEQHQVQYVIKTRAIQPIARVGILRAFDEKAEQEIAQVLERIKRRREGSQ